jgi:peroxiredoxin
MTPLEVVEATPATLPINAQAPAFAGLLGTDGGRYGLSTFRDREALVLAFTSNRCPTVKAYVERLNRLQRDYSPQGVQVVAINSNDSRLYPDESYSRMVERAAEDRYTFPYLADDEQTVARSYGATCTFHLFLLDQERRVRYQGRFDNARIEANATTNDLVDALDELLSGRPVTIEMTRPFGCSLDYVNRSPN